MERLGFDSIEEIKQHEFLRDLNWKDLRSTNVTNLSPMIKQASQAILKSSDRNFFYQREETISQVSQLSALRKHSLTSSATGSDNASPLDRREFG